MAIILPTSFSVQTQAHIDTRLVVDLLADRNNIAEAIRYWGMIVHVIDSTGANDAATYILNKFKTDDVISNNNNWAFLSSVVAGSVEGAIQYRDATGSGTAANDSFQWDVTNSSFNSSTNSTHTAAPRWSFVTGDDNNTIGAGLGSLAWTMVAGDVFTFDNAGTNRSFANGFVTGTGQVVRIANGSFGVFSSNMWGSANLIEPAFGGTYVYSMVGGASNISRNSYQMLSGANSDALGIGAWIHGTADVSKKLTVDGSWGVLLSSNTAAQTVGHGILSDNSVIIGGIDHNIPADSHRSVILGGNALKMPATTPDTVLVPNLMVDGTLTDINSIGRIGIVHSEITTEMPVLNPIEAIKHPGVKGQGQVTMTNGSAAIVGVDTNFLDATPRGLSFWFSLMVSDGTNYYRIQLSGIADATNATISNAYDRAGIRGGYVSPSATFQGITGTYDFWIVDNISEGNYAFAMGNYSYADNYGFSFGGSTIVTGQTGFAIGLTTLVSGSQGFAGGSRSEAAGEQSLAFGLSPLSAKKVLAGGDSSVNISTNTASQTTGFGALANQSVILGGYDHNIPSDSLRSVILGGNTIIATAATTDTVFVPHLRISQGTGATLVQNDSETQIAVIDSTSGQIKWRDVSTIGGGGGGWAVTGDTTLTGAARIIGTTTN